MKLNWHDGIESRERRNGLLIIPPSNRPYWFVGGSDENVRVNTSLFVKNGKWSHTEFQLDVSEGVRALPVTQGWESRKWREGIAVAVGLGPMANWKEISAKLGVAEDDLVGEKPEKGPGKFIIIPNGPARTESESD